MSATDLARWTALWKTAGAKGDCESWHSRLVTLYSEPGRHYHNLRHLEECLNEFESARSLARDPLAVEFALWFHDAVYDTQAKDNEERSAALSRDCFLQSGLSPAFANWVANLIMGTKHAETSKDPDAALVTDIDLSILGRDANRFQEYEAQIRQEYSWVPVEAFAAGRSKILQQFLSRPRIYFHDAFFAKYESQARANIQGSLLKLTR